jgi:hypothetical protein
MPATPVFLFSLLLASAYAAAFHLWQGRTWRQLLVFWLASIAGFALGHFVGRTTEALPLALGSWRIVEGTLGSLLLLFLARWLSS